MARSTWPHRVALALALVVLAYGLHYGRRAVIRAFFVDGPAAAASAPPIAGHGLDPAPRVRVVLLDGLGLAPAGGLPELSRLCAGGWDLRVDVGFPTVSLPVQHVLWTGRRQQSSGMLYRIARVDPPPVDALPLQIAGAVAVAESHPAIIHSFGFADAQPSLGEGEAIPAGWREQFADAALRAVTSPAPLAFVHVLRIDEAGHAAGAASLAYAEAAASADQILGRLVAALADAGDVRWLVLADHGHRPAGGHGGAEASIRIVRACLSGAGMPPAPAEPVSLGLVDLARALADSVGVAPTLGREGRPWDAVVAAAATGSDAAADALPRPSRARGFAAIVAAIILLGVAIRGAGRRGVWVVVWPLVAEAGVAVIDGLPTLSNPVVYPPLGQAMMIAATPGWILLVVGVLVLRRRGRPPLAIVAALLGPAAAIAVAASILAGVGGEGPPLMPIWSAQVSVAATLMTGASLLIAALIVVPTPASRA